MAENRPSIRLDLATEYVRTQMALWGSYHNHKELMAWGPPRSF